MKELKILNKLMKIIVNTLSNCQFRERGLNYRLNAKLRGHGSLNLRTNIYNEIIWFK